LYKEVTKTLEALDSKTLKRYERYFKQIKPTTKREKFRRGLFSIASVHTTWQLNVALYDALWDLKWVHDPELLRARILESRAGLVNGRVKACMQYAAIFHQFPGLLERQAGESWFGFRDRIMDQVHGLGPAKSAFYAELLYLEENRVPCMDTHMFQLYGIATDKVGEVKAPDRVRMETHFDMTCTGLGIKPVTARWVIWDKKQGKTDPRYWSHVLEGRPKIRRQVQVCMSL
jgi:hypothetical protein